MSLAKEAFRPAPRIIISGRDELTAENTLGICELNDESVTLRTAEGALCISGSSLLILCAEADRVVLSGKIDSVSYI